MSEAERNGPMGRAEDRRARQRGGRRAAPTRSSTASTAASAQEPVTVVGGRAAARRAAQGRARGTGKDGRSFIRRMFTWKKIVGTFFGVCLLGMGAFIALYMMIGIPKGNADATLQSNVYKYSDGSLMTRDGQRNREIVDLAKVPKGVQRT